MRNEDLTGKLLNVVIGAREFLAEDEGRWVKGAFAQKKNGELIGDTFSGQDIEDCDKFCVVGAIYKSTYEKYGDAESDFYNILYVFKVKLGRELSSFNDDIETKHSDVIKLLDLIIEKYK